MSDLNEYDYEQAMAEFLANGGQIQQIARGVQSETATTNFWGAPKKKAASKLLSKDESTELKKRKLANDKMQLKKLLHTSESFVNANLSSRKPSKSFVVYQPK